MRLAFCFVLVVLCSAPSSGDEVGKTHKFKKADLPKIVGARAGDTIVRVEEINPADVEEITAKSSNAAVKVKAEVAGGEVRIVIDGTNKGKAIVEWRYTTTNG